MLPARGFALLALAACGPAFDDAEVDYDDPGPGDLGKADIGGGTVADAAEGGGCTTSAVLPLARQIADEMVCTTPGSLMRFEEDSAGVHFSGSAILPYLSPRAHDDLQSAARAHGDVRIMSGFRTLPQQYLLRRWFERGRCGITAAATPGRSNHESGRALDVRNYGSTGALLVGFSWSKGDPADPAHFDHASSDDLRGLDVEAFQRLWNRNHPEDPIAEDGIYSDATATRLTRSPAGGFAEGPCAIGTPGDLVEVDNSDKGRFGLSQGWYAVTDLPGYAGPDYLAIDQATPGWAAWYLDPPSVGSYEIFVHFPAHTTHNSRARYRIRTSGDAAPWIVNVDQRAVGWASIGVYHLSTSAWVSVDTADSDGWTVADRITAEPR